MKKFPKIGQFRNAIKAVHGHCSYNELPIPTLTYEGTIKLHGTNAGVVVHPDNSVDIQGRERIITIDHDNAGFAFYVENVVGKQVFIDAAEELRATYCEMDVSKESIAFYGEFCGGNIQKGVALTGLDKMLVLFNIALFEVGKESEEDAFYLSNTSRYFDTDSPVLHIKDFMTYGVNIDFNKPQEAQNSLVATTDAVEEECPVAKVFGVSGVGEGVVWKCTTQGYSSPQFWFSMTRDKT